MKIIVTGAAGFIGSHVCERLQSLGHHVIGIDNFSPYYDVRLKRQNQSTLLEKSIAIEEVDITTVDLHKYLTNDIDVVFHLAAHPGIAQSSSFDDYSTNNTMATRCLLKCIEGLKKKPYFVNISTSSVYGKEATCSEDAATNPASWYGITKLAAEQLVLKECKEGNLKGTSLRLYSVYGPRERPDKLYTRLIDCALNDKVFPLYQGSNTHLRSFTYVGDIVDGIVSVLKNMDACNRQVINLGTEVENTTQKGIDIVESILKKFISIAQFPAREGDQLRTKANIDKARRLLNYNPTTTLKQGLTSQIRWFKETQQNDA